MAVERNGERLGGLLLVVLGALGLWAVVTGHFYGHVHAGLAGAQAALQTLPVLLALVVLFGVGILISMSLFGVVLARVVSTRAVSRLGGGASAITSLASIGLGIFWIYRV